MKYRAGVDLIVVNYKSPGDIAAFLQCFKEVQFEVPCTLSIVNVDPDLEDDSAVEANLVGIEVPVAYGCWESNVGYAKACNVAASNLADYDAEGIPKATVAFFNADTRLRPGVLDQCHWELHQHKDWGVVGPRQIDDYGKVVHAGIFGSQEYPILRGWQQQDEGQYNDVNDEAVSVSGSAYFVKRQAWDELTACPIHQLVSGSAPGAFLPTQHYYEETWCSYHAFAHGWKIAYLGSTVMTHLWHKASPVGGFADRQMPISQQMFRDACEMHGIPHD